MSMAKYDLDIRVGFLKLVGDVVTYKTNVDHHSKNDDHVSNLLAFSSSPNKSLFTVRNVVLPVFDRTGDCVYSHLGKAIQMRRLRLVILSVFPRNISVGALAAA